MRRFAPVLVLLASTLATVVCVGAETPPFKVCSGTPAPADVNAARGLFEAGKTSYNEGDYPKAISYWRDAFDRDCTAVPLLLNLSNAYEKADQFDGAVLCLDTYLKRKPNADDASTIQKRMDALKAKAKAQSATAASVVPTVAPPPTVTAAVTATSTGAPPPPPSDGPGIAPWVVAAAGGVVAATGVVVYVVGSGKISSANKDCPVTNGIKACKTDSAKSEGNSGRSLETVGGALLIGGVVVAAGGVVWGLVAKPKSPAASYIVPTVGPTFSGLVAGGSFLRIRVRTRQGQSGPCRPSRKQPPPAGVAGDRRVGHFVGAGRHFRRGRSASGRSFQWARSTRTMTQRAFVCLASRHEATCSS